MRKYTIQSQNSYRKNACIANLWIQMTPQISSVKLSLNTRCTIIAHNYNTCPFESCNTRQTLFPLNFLVPKRVEIIYDGHNLKNGNTIQIRAILIGMSYGTVQWDLHRFPNIGVRAWNFILISGIKCTCSLEKTIWNDDAAHWCSYEISSLVRHP